MYEVCFCASFGLRSDGSAGCFFFQLKRRTWKRRDGHTGLRSMLGLLSKIDGDRSKCVHSNLQLIQFFLKVRCSLFISRIVRGSTATSLSNGGAQSAFGHASLLSSACNQSVYGRRLLISTLRSIFDGCANYPFEDRGSRCPLHSLDVPQTHARTTATTIVDSCNAVYTTF